MQWRAILQTAFALFRWSQALHVRSLCPQAAANTLLAHLVSIIFLTYLIRKIALAYKKLIEWSEGLVDSVAKLN